MFEKVNPKHPDKIADRIAGAIVDLAYTKKQDPKIAVEVLIGHGECNVIVECDSDLHIKYNEVISIVVRISEDPSIHLNLKIVPQDVHLANNQSQQVKCGDNGIFKGCKVTEEQHKLVNIASILYDKYNSDGKYIIDKDKLVICQSNANKQDIIELLNAKKAIINPLGYWTGGINVDSGATNRKLGSDMGDSVTGGGLHGKDLSKADVTVNIYCHILAEKTGHNIEACCAIGDNLVMNVEYIDMIKTVKHYIDSIGGFEKLAEWGLIRPK